jgi:hypothetical protein
MCDSGNCTWSPFTSLGICSECASWTGTIGNLDCFVNNTDASPHVCDVHVVLPSLEPSLEIDVPISCFVNLDGLEGTCFGSNATDSRDWSSSGAMITFVTVNVTSKDGSYEGVACSFSWCAKLFNDTKVVNGILFNEPTISFPLVDGREDNQLEIRTADTNGVVVPPYQTFYMSTVDMQTINIYLENLFLASAVKGDDFSFHDSDPAAIGPALEKSQDLRKVAENVATSMTNTIQSSNGSIWFEGVVYDEEPYIRVRWIWLTLPAIVSLLPIPLLIICILWSKRQESPLWKASSLAILIHQIQEFEIRRHQVNSLSDLNRLTKGIQVKLGGESIELSFIKS